MQYDAVAEDTGTELAITITDQDGLALDITGATVQFRWKSNAGTLITQTATIVDPLAGTVKYKFAAGELEYPYVRVEVIVTFASGEILKSTALVTLQVRQELA